MPTDDDGDDDAVERVPPPPPDDRLWRHPSEVSAFGPERLGATAMPALGAAGRSSAVWPIALVAGLVGAALCGGVLALTGNLSVEGDRAVERVKVTPLPASSYIFAEPADAGALAQNVGPSVVRLLVTTAEGDSEACGVVLRDDGVVVTSAHEIEGATAITVALSDGRTFEGELVGVDMPSDVGVLAIDASGLTVAVRGSTDDLQAGARAMVVGTTRHGEPAVATGVVSAMRQRLDVDGESLHGLIQTDVPVEAGWSGGPLVDETGAVIGITTDLGGDGTRFGFATPIELVHRLAEELLLYGKVAHGWLGIEGADLTDTAAGVEGGRAGAQVMRVMPGSPADESGLQVGDIIIEIGGEPIRSSSDLVVALRGHQPGDRMVVRFWRGVEPLQAEVTIDHHPDG